MTKPEKMTDEELEMLERIASGADESWDDRLRGWVRKAAAHIAALTAERDEAVERRRLALLDVDRERTAWHEKKQACGILRERVRELEAALDEGSEQGREWLRERDEAHARLAAIRQRAEQLRGLTLRDVMSGEWNKQAATFIHDVLAGDATEAAPVEGVSHSDSNSAPKAPPEAFTHEKGLDSGTLEDGRCVNQQPRSPESERHLQQIARSAGHHLHLLAASPSATPEPTVVEAFATAKLYVVGDGVQALSLLERRMGAMARAMKEAMRSCRCMALGETPEMCDFCSSLSDALTDTPPVFTLEEVERLAREHCPTGDASRLVRALTALRRTP